MSYAISNAGTINLLRKTLRTIDGIPAPVLQSFADLDKVEARGDIPGPDESEVYAAALKAVLADRDPFNDAAVKAKAAAFALHARGDFTAALITAARNAVVDVLNTYADEIVTALKNEVDDHGAKLSAAYAVLGDVDINRASDVLALGVNAVEHWNTTNASIARLNALAPIWTVLAEVTRFASPSLDPTLRLSPVDLDLIYRVGRRANAWDIVRNGGVIDLATRESAKARQVEYPQALEREQQARNAGPSSNPIPWNVSYV